MKKQTRDQLKAIMVQAIQEYFEQSGVNEILLTLYESKSSHTSTSKVNRIIEENKTQTKKVSQTQKLKQKYGNMGLITEDDDYGITKRQSVKLDPNLKVILNQNIDNLANGTSILDNIQSLPDFLKRGLGKVNRQ